MECCKNRRDIIKYALLDDLWLIQGGHGLGETRVGVDQ